MKPDWSFARRPFWIFSHLFAATVIVSFVLLGFWQLSRHHWRDARNAVIASRSEGAALDVTAALARPPDDVDYQLVTAHGSWVNPDLVRVANRSQGDVAGQYVVATFRLDDGRLILVNRGFVPLAVTVQLQDVPATPVTLHGWLRTSVPKPTFGATDPGTGTVAPRLDVAAVGRRVSEPVVPVALQLDRSQATTPATFPDPVPLPPLDGGPHISYMLQWWTFALLGVLFYGSLLRRNARRHRTTARVATEPEDGVEGEPTAGDGGPGPDQVSSGTASA